LRRRRRPGRLLLPAGPARAPATRPGQRALAADAGLHLRRLDRLQPGRVRADRRHAPGALEVRRPRLPFRPRRRRGTRPVHVPHRHRPGVERLRRRRLLRRVRQPPGQRRRPGTVHHPAVRGQPPAGRLDPHRLPGLTVMVVGWLAVAVPLGVFTVFGGAYSVATAVWRERGSRLVDRYGQYVYLAAILAAAVPLAVLAWPSAG